MKKRHVLGLALILGAVLWAVLLGGGIVEAAALPIPIQPGDSKLLFVSANRVMEYDALTDTSTKIQYVQEGVPSMPTRAAGGDAIAWSVGSSTGPMQTYVRETFTDPGHQTTHILTADLASFPRLSPDGTKLLYIQEEPDPLGGLTNNLHIWRVSDGTEVLSIPDVDSADWSPDGEKIVFASYPRAALDTNLVTLYVYDLASAQSTKMPAVRLAALHEVNTYSPRWSSGGDWIAFQRYNFDKQTIDIVLTNPAGTSERTLMTGPLAQLGMGMEWIRMPDGTERLFVESVEAGGAPYFLVEVPGTHPGPAGGRIPHAALSSQAQPDFTDISSAHPFYRQIRDLASLRVVGGFADGSFGPSAFVKRAQYAKMITIALAVHDSTWTNWNSPTFPDVPRPAIQDDQFRYPFDYVEEAAAADLVKGDLTGHFNPGSEITRVQLALLIARAGTGRLEPAVPADSQVFTDLAGLSQEARDAIALVYHNGIISGKTATTFAPYAPATRGHAAVMTWRLMKQLGMVD